MIAQFCTSQNAFPQKAVIENQTVCIFRIDQLDTINGWLVNWDRCEELGDSLHSQIKTSDKIIASQKLNTLSLTRQVSLLTSITTEKDYIITNYREICKGKDKEIKGLKWQRNGLIIISIILGVIVVL